ncbi:MAG: DUF6478 family protein [Pseudomonadota bacterium]
MRQEGSTFLHKRRLARALRRASELPDQAARLSPQVLAEAEADTERLRQAIDAADQATEMARAKLAAGSQISAPEQCDFALRPDIWCQPIRPRGGVAIGSPTALSPFTTLHHDCHASEIGYRQIRAASGIARYHLALEVYRFTGSFLSLVHPLTDGAVAGLTRGHIFVIALEIEWDEPLEIYARLNLQSGPNTEQMVREMPVRGGHAVAEFDLAYTKINEKRMGNVWLDLILEAPQMNRVLLRDLTITRAPRADI